MGAYLTSEFRTSFGEKIFQYKYAKFPGETWKQRASDIVEDVCGSRWGKATALMSKDDLQQLQQYIQDFKFLPGGRYIWYSGRGWSYFNNCFLLKAEEDTREEWAAVMQRSVSCLMTGGGIGIDYSILRAKGKPLAKTGGVSSGPLPLMMMVNEAGRGVMQGGSRRSAIYASLNWQHEDIHDFLKAKDWSEVVREQKLKDFNFPGPLDMTNISVNYDDAALAKHNIHYGEAGEEGPWNLLADNPIFKQNCLQALSTGEPGLSFNFGNKQNETLRNALISSALVQ